MLTKVLAVVVAILGVGAVGTAYWADLIPNPFASSSDNQPPCLTNSVGCCLVPTEEGSCCTSVSCCPLNCAEGQCTPAAGAEPGCCEPAEELTAAPRPVQP
jgi:hypothetical protein